MSGILLFLTFFTACSPNVNAGFEMPTLQSSVQPVQTQTSSPAPLPLFPTSITLSPYLPEGFIKALTLPNDLLEDEVPVDESLQITIGTENPVSSWVYALVAPFPTVTDDVSFTNLLAFWKGEAPKDFPAKSLLASPNTQKVLESLWGNASPEFVKPVTATRLSREAWEKEDTWAIIPFEEINPRWKVISIDQRSPIHKDFDLQSYPLTIFISLQGKSPLMEAALEKYGPASQTPFAPGTNRDPNHLTTVILTGVTALVRGTASMMELKGMTYPGRDIRDILRQGDITHISNEIPFSPKCPMPYLQENNLVFCSRPQYIELLRDVGTDIVELTGDHFQDWGPEAMFYTLEMYKKEGWNYYGGGANLAEARRPALLEHNGNKIAFLGCNAKAPGYAGATADQPGAAFCDFKQMQKEVKALVSQGYLPIVTFQHLEYYTYTANPTLQADFENIAKAGAIIVSGSQAHQPHAIEFYGGAFLHYGLGNLFFDQIVEGIPTRQAFIDRHVFYNGNYINTELISIWFVDLARARLMTQEERQDLLATVFKASGW
ncbi:MAG: CapA family protein [Anaerolineaceae bacterium]|nr:CapA family protein [Anaerolineaceae bacterium]